MNSLTAQQRKLVYLAAICMLLFPIIYLGRPATSTSAGGKMAIMRQEEGWGEDNLGDVDPSSATMNLVLLGLRGIATDVLWVRAQDQKDRKQWGELKNTVNSIVLLQPHYEKVWEFQGWNQAYNVSAEWDRVEDRYYWVKEGGKFLKQGTRRNIKSPALLWSLAEGIYSKKIGRSDEWKQFREFFQVDPDTKLFNGGTDPDFVPAGETDNYMVAKDWFRKANIVQKRYQQSKLQVANYLFRSKRARAQFDFANTKHREGTFDQTSVDGWKEAFKNWTKEYNDGSKGFGQEELAWGYLVKLEASEEDFIFLAKKNNTTVAEIKNAINQLQDTTNYRYWRELALIESDPQTMKMHKLIYEGQQLYFRVDYEKAIIKLEEGMTIFEALLKKYPKLVNGDLTIEEAVMAQYCWRNSLESSGREIPSDQEDFPLKSIWLKNQYMLTDIQRRLERQAAVLLSLDKKKNDKINKKK